MCVWYWLFLLVSFYPRTRLWLETRFFFFVYLFLPFALDPAKLRTKNNLQNALLVLSIFSLLFMICVCLCVCVWHLFFSLVVQRVRLNTEVVAATWMNAHGGLVAVTARLALIIKTSAATSASVRWAIWASIATWKSSLAPPSPPPPISSLLSSLVSPPSSVCCLVTLTQHLKPFSSSSRLHLWSLSYLSFLFDSL